MAWPVCGPGMAHRVRRVHAAECPLSGQTWVVINASSLRDDIVAEIDATEFRALGLHVLAGSDEATHMWQPDIRRDVHSASKGVCVLAAGIAADEGMLDLDEPVAAFLPHVPRGDGVDEVTLRDLLAMRSGIDLGWSETLMTDWPDLAVEFLGRASRGRVFQYANASTYTAMRALQARVGDVAEYTQGRLFDPLGIPTVEWERCPNGFVTGGGGLWLTTSELALLGRLVRDNGLANGQRIAPSALITDMRTAWMPAGKNPGYTEYSLGAWNGPGSAWRWHGAHGQIILFLGETVVTFTADDHFRADALAARIVNLAANA